MKPLLSVPLRLFEVTVTFTAPAAAPAGVLAVIVVLFTTTTFVAAVLPKVTVAGLAKFAPVIVTGVPPDCGPEFGVTPLTVGALAGAGRVNAITAAPNESGLELSLKFAHVEPAALLRM